MMRFHLTATGLGISALVAISATFTPVAAHAADVPYDTDPFYTVLTSTWGGSSVTSDGWRLDGSGYSPANPATPTVKRRAEYNPSSGRNLQIVDASSKLLWDVDSAGNSIRLAGVTYDGDTAANKYINIVTRRHCTADYATPLVATGFPGANESIAVCPAGTVTRYSTGRISSVPSKGVSGSFNLVTRVNLPTAKMAGTRFAVWLNNNDPDLNPAMDGIRPTYCDSGNPETDLSEFDTFEWYGKTTNLTQTAHVSCSYSAVSGTRNASKTTVSAATGWKYASVEFDGKRTRYFMDRNYDTPTLAVAPKGNTFGYSDSLWNSAPTMAQWNRAVFSTSQSDDPGITMGWQVIAQGEVFGSGYGSGGNFSTVVDSATFPAQTLQLDYVKLYKHA